MELNRLHKTIAELEKEFDTSLSQQKQTIDHLNEQVSFSKVFVYNSCFGLYISAGV